MGDLAWRFRRRAHLSVLFIAASVGCGRVDFDPLDGSGSGSSSTDSYAAAVLADQPSSYWRLGEPAGTTIARDEVGGHAGVYIGACELAVPGAIAGGNTAARFDGSSCFLDVGDAYPLADGVPFTIELWVAPTIASGNTRFLVSRNTLSGTDNGYQLCFQATFSWFERLYNGAGVGYLEVGALLIDTFQMVVVTYDGTTQRFYMNGTELGSVDVGLGPRTGGKLVFGDSARQQFFKFEGDLDEIAFYDHALSPERVAAHYAAR